MFTTTRHFYSKDIEGETMGCTFKEFININKAIAYAHKYAKGLRFAGVQIEDENGKLLYEITSDFETIDHRN